MFRQKFSKRTYAVEPIPFMNEVFVSGPFKSAKVGSTSDSTFTTRHNDGPYALLPFYRPGSTSLLRW
ncbi:phospholipidmethyltransferase [Ectocarpus siliculosus]|uniref:Phospholipidmethyltransferase n=1 Tax=Ectocarpus siliculosus TaxID=2880 RepID=D7FR91_ECTSI|nr:phospholipidmethyltransferase [Ectocarpus siliculosus]|eukprot:CBJ49216.1 phospholipidmethyltransferase [Ectocarpus siliculosus]